MGWRSGREEKSQAWDCENKWELSSGRQRAGVSGLHDHKVNQRWGRMMGTSKREDWPQASPSFVTDAVSRCPCKLMELSKHEEEAPRQLSDILRFDYKLDLSSVVLIRKQGKSYPNHLSEVYKWLNMGSSSSLQGEDSMAVSSHLGTPKDKLQGRLFFFFFFFVC